MNHSDNEFDRQMRDKFEDFTPEVPSGLWDGIAARLDEQVESDAPKVLPITPKKKGGATWWSIAAAVVLLVSAAVWLSRPSEVIYLQGSPKLVSEISEVPAENIEEVKEEVVREPLNLAPIKSFFASRKRNEVAKDLLLEDSNDMEQEIDETALFAQSEPEPKVKDPSTETVLFDEHTIPAEDDSSHYVQAVPELKPLIVLEEEEETMYAKAPDEKAGFGVSNILNMVVDQVDAREDKLIRFSSDSEGSLKVDFNFGLAKTRKKRIK